MGVMDIRREGHIKNTANKSGTCNIVEKSNEKEMITPKSTTTTEAKQKELTNIPKSKPKKKKNKDLIKQNKSNVKSNLKNKSTKSASHDESNDATINDLFPDNPYIIILNKRLRALRKKMDKIKSLENACKKEKKQLNDQQTELLNSKDGVAKTIAEYEGLKQQFNTVITQENKERKQEQEKLLAVESTNISSEPVTVDNETNTTTVQSEFLSQIPQEGHNFFQNNDNADVINYRSLYEILKLLHLINFYQSMGKELPQAIDYFGRVLLGKTRPPAELSFDDNLLESIEEAQRYINCNNTYVACDMTYKDIYMLIQDSCNSFTQKEIEVNINEQMIEANSSNTDFNKSPLKPDNEQPINFFTDSIIDKESSIEAVAGSEVDVADLDDVSDRQSRQENLSISGENMQCDVTSSEAKSIDEENIKPKEKTKHRYEKKNNRNRYNKRFSSNSEINENENQSSIDRKSKGSYRRFNSNSQNHHRRNNQDLYSNGLNNNTEVGSNSQRPRQSYKSRRNYNYTHHGGNNRKDTNESGIPSNRSDGYHTENKKIHFSE